MAGMQLTDIKLRITNNDLLMVDGSFSYENYYNIVHRAVHLPYKGIPMSAIRTSMANGLLVIRIE